MVFSHSGLREHLKRYISYVQGVFNVWKVILYGSYAYGSPHDDSDIDLVVLSEDFKGMPKIERHQRLGWLAWQGRIISSPSASPRKNLKRPAWLASWGKCASGES